MSFQAEFSRIPKFVITLAALVYGCAVIVLWRLAIPHEEPQNAESFALQVFAIFVLSAFFAAYILLVGYVYADAKRRNMRHVMWTWLAALIPNGIGLILYFIMRDPLPLPCPGCARAVAGSYPFCPHCGFAVAPRCPKCSAAVKHDWANCPFCGTTVKNAPAVKA